MSINLVDAGDGWFNRQGAFGGAFNYVAALYGSANDTAFQTIWSLFATSDQAAVQVLPSELASWRTTGQSYTSVLAADAATASVLQVNRAFPLVPPTFAASVGRVRAQMIADGDSIQRATLTSSVTADAGNLGDTELFVSTTNVFGDPIDTVYAETMTATCTAAGTGFTGSVTVIGEPLVPTYSYEWPGGSGTAAGLSITDPAEDGIVSNAALSEFTVANTPDDWTIINGSAGSTVFKSITAGVRGDDCVYLESDGSQATKLGQSVSLSTNTVYAVTFQAKMNSNSASGNLVVQLYDPDAGSVIDNDAGDSLQATYTINGGAGNVGTSYDLFTVYFSTPRQLPDTVELRIGYGTAGVSTRQLFLCNVQVILATPLYGPAGTGTAGPYAVAVANTTASAVDDTWTLAFTNDLGADSFAMLLERVHGLRSLGLYLPSDNAPTISDNLIVEP